MDYLTDTLIFVISGVIIAGRICTGYQDSSPHFLTGIDYAWAGIVASAPGKPLQKNAST